MAKLGLNGDEAAEEGFFTVWAMDVEAGDGDVE